MAKKSNNKTDVDIPVGEYSKKNIPIIDKIKFSVALVICGAIVFFATFLLIEVMLIPVFREANFFVRQYYYTYWDCEAKDFIKEEQTVKLYGKEFDLNNFLSLEETKIKVICFIFMYVIFLTLNMVYLFFKNKTFEEMIAKKTRSEKQLIYMKLKEELGE